MDSGHSVIRRRESYERLLKMKYRYIENHSSIATKETNDPSTIPVQVPQFQNKGQFRAWCADNKTNHCFYTLAEGDNKFERIGEDNPVNRVYGFVADYDAPVDWPRVDDLISARIGDAPMPTWRTKTYSGYIRLIWEFSEPIPLAPEISDAFFKRLATELRAQILFAGYDRSSEKVSQTFEVGTDWVKIGKPLDVLVAKTVLLKSANDTTIKTSETTIPLEDIATEVEKRFPNRWKKDFIVGARGPLFWIPDGIDRDGCQVREDGIICYSDRAEKGFMSWRDIFGKKFVDEYETAKVRNLVDQFWFNGKSFYKLLNSNPVAIPKEQMVLELRKIGFSHKPKKGQMLSEVESALLTISNEGRVDEVAPVVFDRHRVVTFNGRRILNSSKTAPVRPASTGDIEHWPWLHSFLMPFFSKDVEGRETLPYFLAWFKRLYIALLDGRLDQGQLMILLGPTGRGKTLLTNQIIGRAVGGYADASDYLSGNTSFNRDLCGSAMWVVDDQVAASTYADQRKFVELTKRCVANPRLEYHAKYADAVSLPWAGRVAMSLNLDANSLAALPTLDSSNRDKIIALRLNSEHRVSFRSNAETEHTIMDELPFFLKWLIDYTPPEHVVSSNRFGVQTYIDPFIEAAAYDNSSRSEIAELVEFFARKFREGSEACGLPETPTRWLGTLTDFQVTLHELNGGRAVGSSNNLGFVRRGMTVLEEVGRNNPKIRPVKSYGDGGGKLWEINVSSDFDITRHEGN
jgi:hypothetical protein